MFIHCLLFFTLRWPTTHLKLIEDDVGVRLYASPRAIASSWIVNGRQPLAYITNMANVALEFVAKRPTVKILQLGLGGGTLNAILLCKLGKRVSQYDVIELDPLVVDAAINKFFPRMFIDGCQGLENSIHIHHGDANNVAKLVRDSFDVVIVDCCFDDVKGSEARLDSNVFRDLGTRAACHALLVVNIVATIDGLLGVSTYATDFGRVHELLKMSGWAHVNITHIPSKTNHLVVARRSCAES